MLRKIVWDKGSRLADQTVPEQDDLLLDAHAFTAPGRDGLSAQVPEGLLRPLEPLGGPDALEDPDGRG